MKAKQRPRRDERNAHMTRTRASAKASGSRFERDIADYLAEVFKDRRIDRKVRTGALDKGDIANVRVHDENLTIEAKQYGGRLMPAEWTAEAETERVNDNGLAGVVVAKRRGVTDPGSQWIICTVDELVAIISGNRGHIKEKQ